MMRQKDTEQALKARGAPLRRVSRVQTAFSIKELFSIKSCSASHFWRLFRADFRPGRERRTPRARENRRSAAGNSLERRQNADIKHFLEQIQHREEWSY
jgi:hypothetical protein